MFEPEQFPGLAPDQREAIADAHRAVDKFARTLVADLTQHDHAMQRMRDDVNELDAAWGVVPEHLKATTATMSEVIATLLRERDQANALSMVMEIERDTAIIANAVPGPAYWVRRCQSKRSLMNDVGGVEQCAGAEGHRSTCFGEVPPGGIEDPRPLPACSSSPAGTPGQVDSPTPVASPAKQLYVESAGDLSYMDENGHMTVECPRVVLCGDEASVAAFMRKHPLFTFMSVQP